MGKTSHGMFIRLEKTQLNPHLVAKSAGWKKSYKQNPPKGSLKPIKNGMFTTYELVQDFAGPSTVCLKMSMLMGKMVALSQVSVGKVVMLNSQHLGR
jgi:hypothetical protein